MKILYYFQELPTYMFQWQRTHIINELSKHGVEVETFNPLLFDSVEEANQQVVEHIKNGHYELFMSNVCYYKMLFIETVEAIKKLGIPTLTISWDNLMVPYMDKVLAPHFDLVWLTAKETARLYKNWEVNYFFAPYAANPYTYSYNGASYIKRCACFIGNPHGSRALMINTLTKNGLPVEIYHGRRRENVTSITASQCKYDIIYPSTRETLFNRLKFREGWKLMYGSVNNKLKGVTSLEDNNQLIKFPGLSYEDMVATYSISALSMASTSAGHTDILKNPLSIINLRNFEIPMCGGIEVCRYNEELASYFEEGKEILFYRTEEELVDKVRYYIEEASDAEILKMKRAARKRAETEHTWWNRFKIAFDILGLKYD